MPRSGPLACLAVVLATGAAAQVTLSIPLSGARGLVPAAYACDDGTAVDVLYLSSDQNVLAVLTLDGTERIFVNVVAASGARYVAGALEWWSKGDAATLTDLTGGSDPRHCVVEDGPSLR